MSLIESIITIKMMKGIFVALLLVAFAKASNIDWANLQQREINPAFPLYRYGNNGRVVGGEEAIPHSFPFQAGLIMTLNNGQQAFCGGSLISPSAVLTAAHCADGVKSIEVILGAHKVREDEPSQVRLTSTSFIINPNWNSILLHDDIAIVKLPEPVELNENITLVNLPSKSDEDETFTGEIATVSGWGKDSDSATGISPVLRYTSNDVITNLKCTLSYPIVIRHSHVCVSGHGGKSSCNGDSGGPLTIKVDGKMKQIGLVSFGRATGCENGHPAVYTRLTSYLDWIKNSVPDLIVN